MTKRILIVEVNWVGDVIFSTPFIKAVRQAYPDSYIACLVHPRCKEMLESNPRINELIAYDEEGEHAGLIGKARLVIGLRKKHFDTAFILHRSFTKALLTFAAGIKERIGYATKNRAFVLSKPVEVPAGGVHKVEYFLGLARAAGIAPKDDSYEFFVSDKDRQSVREFLERDGVYDEDIAVICPGGNWDPKRWPKDKFAKLADGLMDKFGLKVVIAGAKKDIYLAEDIKKRMNTRPVIACGTTTLKELGALLERASLVVANDTGPMHMAVAVKTKVIALFGPTSHELTGPYGKGHYEVITRQAECEIPCYDAACKDYRCMDAIKVEDVLEVARQMLTERICR